MTLLVNMIDELHVNSVKEKRGETRLDWNLSTVSKLMRVLLIEQVNMS